MKIKSFVGLNGGGDSYNLAEDKLPNEGDEVYFTLIEPPYDEYYKGTFQKGNFISDNETFTLEEVEGWCLADDPTAIQHLIFYIDLGFYFDAADWESPVRKGKVYPDYTNAPAAVDIKDLNLSLELKELLTEYTAFCYYPRISNLPEEDKVTSHNVSQLGLFIYEEIRKELIDKAYVVHLPFDGQLNEDYSDFPMYIDNNPESYWCTYTEDKLPPENKELFFQLNNLTGAFKRGYFINNCFQDKKNNKFSTDEVIRWSRHQFIDYKNESE